MTRHALALPSLVLLAVLVTGCRYELVADSGPNSRMAWRLDRWTGEACVFAVVDVSDKLGARRFPEDVMLIAGPCAK